MNKNLNSIYITFLSGALPDALTVWIVLSALPHGKESFFHKR